MHLFQFLTNKRNKRKVFPNKSYNAPFLHVDLAKSPPYYPKRYKGTRYVKGASGHAGNIAHGSVRTLTSNHAPSTFEGFFMLNWKIIAHYVVRFIDGAF